MTAASSARAALLGRVIGSFAENGVRDTSLRTLAAAIGVSQRTVHDHFGSRQDLLAAVIADQVRTLDTLFDEGENPFRQVCVTGRTRPTRHRHSARCSSSLTRHAMHRQPYATDASEAVFTAHVRAFTRAYARVCDAGPAQSLARLTPRHRSKTVVRAAARRRP